MDKNMPSVKIRKKPLGQRIKNNFGFYLMFLPVLVFVVVIYYWPMLGIRYSFFSSKMIRGGGLEWTFVGLKHFETMFKAPEFWTAFKNTLIISIVKLLLNTFAAVVISIFLNEMTSLFCKKAVQEYKIAVVPGNAFMVSESDVTYSFRLNYSTPTDEAIDKGTAILGQLTKEMFD